jgi:hypothetical protein
MSFIAYIVRLLGAWCPAVGVSFVLNRNACARWRGTHYLAQGRGKTETRVTIPQDLTLDHSPRFTIRG